MNYTFLQTLCLEAVLWRLHCPHALLSTDTEWGYTNVRYHPKQCLQTHGAVCWKTADSRLAAGRDKVHMAEFSWREWHRPKGCQKGLDCFLNIIKGLQWNDMSKPSQSTMKFKYWALHGECRVSPSQIYWKLLFSGEEKKMAGERWGRALFLH